MMNKSKTRQYTLLVGLILLGGVYRLTGLANERMARLSVDSLPQKHQQVQPLDTKNLYPVVVQHQRVEEKKDGKEFDTNTAFVGRTIDEPPSAPPPPPNFEAMFRDGIQVDAITPLGAFVRGMYYPINTPMNEFTITNGAQSVTPKIVATRAGSIDIRWGKSGFMNIRVPGAEGK